MGEPRKRKGRVLRSGVKKKGRRERRVGGKVAVEPAAAAGDGAPGGLVRLPRQALARVLLFLPAGSLVSVSHACRALHAAASESLWRDMCVRDFGPRCSITGSDPADTSQSSPSPAPASEASVSSSSTSSTSSSSSSASSASSASSSDDDNASDSDEEEPAMTWREFAARRCQTFTLPAGLATDRALIQEQTCARGTWHLLATCTLCSRTSGSGVVHAAILAFMARFAHASAYLEACEDPGERDAIRVLIHPLGMQEQRMNALERMTRQFLFEIPRLEDVTQLFGVGAFARDSHRVFGHGLLAGVQDRNVAGAAAWLCDAARRRVSGLTFAVPPPGDTRHGADNSDGEKATPGGGDADADDDEDDDDGNEK